MEILFLTISNQKPYVTQRTIVIRIFLYKIPHHLNLLDINIEGRIDISNMLKKPEPIHGTEVIPWKSIQNCSHNTMLAVVKVRNKLI